MSDLYLIVNFKAKEYLSPAKFGLPAELTDLPDSEAAGIPKKMIEIAESVCESGRWPDNQVAIVGNGRDAVPILTPDGFYPSYDFVLKHFKDISDEIPKAD